MRSAPFDARSRPDHRCASGAPSCAHLKVGWRRDNAPLAAAARCVPGGAWRVDHVLRLRNGLATAFDGGASALSINPCKHALSDIAWPRRQPPQRRQARRDQGDADRNAEGAASRRPAFASHWGRPRPADTAEPARQTADIERENAEQLHSRSAAARPLPDVWLSGAFREFSRQPPLPRLYVWPTVRRDDPIDRIYKGDGDGAERQLLSTVRRGTGTGRRSQP